MTENVAKLVGVVVVAVLVVVGVVATSGGDDVDFTRNAAFTKLPAAQRARLAPAFVERAAPKAIDTGRLEKTGLIWFTPKPNVTESTGAGNTDKAGIWLQSGGTDALGTGKASVLQGRGVDGKGGTSSMFSKGVHNNGGISGATGKAGIWLQSGGTNGVADRLTACANSFEEIKVTVAGAGSGTVANSLTNVMVSSYTDSGRITYIGNDEKDPFCVPTGIGASGGQEGEALLHDTGMAIRVGKDEAGLLATCMESKVGDVFLESHIRVSAAECVATVLPALSPERAKQLGTYWQTQQQLICVPPDCSD